MFERFARAARYAIVEAQEQGRQLRSPSIDVEHVLLGLAMSPDDGLKQVLADNGVAADTLREALSHKRSGEPLGAEDAAALRSIGIDLDAVRESLEATFGEDALDRVAPAPEQRRSRFGFGGGMNVGHIPFSRDAKKVLELSLREALTRGDRSIEAGHVLLGVLRAPNPVARSLLGGPDGIDHLRRAVHDLLDRAA
jgi:ATP-dependent Clp protease ATP-binding subunit ClpA